MIDGTDWHIIDKDGKQYVQVELSVLNEYMQRTRPQPTHEAVEKIREVLENSIERHCSGEYTVGYCSEADKVAADIAALLPTLSAGQVAEWVDRPDEYSGLINEALCGECDHKAFAKAMDMVSNRHSKSALVHLVYWLLTRTAQPMTEAEREKMVEDMLYAFLRERSAQMGENFTRQMFDELQAADKEAYSDEMFQMKAALAVIERRKGE